MLTILVHKAVIVAVTMASCSFYSLADQSTTTTSSTEVLKRNLRRVEASDDEDEDVIYEDVPDMSDADIKRVMDWIAAEVVMVKNPFCWKDSYGRGVGTLPGRVADCPSGYTNHGLTCARGTDDIWAPSKVADCPSGYTNMGLTCFRPHDSIHAPSRVADCPRGYTNMGLTCQKWGWPWEWHTLGTSSFTCPSGYFKSSISHRCHKNCPPGYTNEGEFCSRHVNSLGMSSMTCPNGYFQSKITARCHKNCPSGYTNTGETCHRKLSILGLESMSCKEGERSGVGGARCYPLNGDCFDNGEKDAGLCYPRCRDSYDGVGPVCWGFCDNSMVNCGLACAKSSGECALAVADQVISTLVLAANVATLGLATPATAGATATIRVGGKTVAGTTKVGKALVHAVQVLQTVKPNGLAQGATIVRRIIHAKTGSAKGLIKTKVGIDKAVYKAMQVYREEFAENFAEQTSQEIEDELDSHFHSTTSKFLKGLWGERMINELKEANNWQIAGAALAAASVVDISGVTGVVSAYAKPTCNAIVHFPCTSADLKCNGSSGGATGGGESGSGGENGGGENGGGTDSGNSQTGNGGENGNGTESECEDKPKIIDALDCVQGYAENDKCDWDHWTEMYINCELAHSIDDFLLPKVKDDQVCKKDTFQQEIRMAVYNEFSVCHDKGPIQFRERNNGDGKVATSTSIRVSGGGWNKVYCESTTRPLQDGDSFTIRGNKNQVGVGLCIDAEPPSCSIRFNHQCVGFYGDVRNTMMAANDEGKEYKINADNYPSRLQGLTYDKDGNCVQHVSSSTKMCIPLPEHFKNKQLRAIGQVWNSASASIV